MTGCDRRLLWHGMLLFLLGLLTGFVIQQFSNPRMALAAHLEGILNGLFLLVLGVIWAQVRRSVPVARLARACALYGAWVNWGITTAAAALGTSALTPIAAAGHAAAPWAERLAAIGFGSVGVAMLTAAALLLWGLRGSRTAAGAVSDARVGHRLARGQTPGSPRRVRSRSWQAAGADQKNGAPRDAVRTTRRA